MEELPVFIGIKLAEPNTGEAISPGSKVDGTVVLMAGEKSSATVLQLAVVGREATKIKYEKKEGSEGKKQAARQENTFFLLRWVLANFSDSGGLVGQYEFPFEFQLPETKMPSTFRQKGRCSVQYEKKMTRGKCALQYLVEARLTTPDSSKVAALARVPLIVADVVPPVKSVEPVFVRDYQTVRACYCVNKGGMELKVALNRDAFVTGDSIEILYEAKNNSSVDVDVIEVELKEVISWKADDEGSTQYLCKKENMSPAKLNEGKKYIPLEEDPVTIVVPATLRADYSGDLVSCHHSISVTLNTGFGITNPTVEMPIRIYDQHVKATVRGVDASEKHKGATGTQYGRMKEDEETDTDTDDENAHPSRADGWNPIVADKAVLHKADAIESKYPSNPYHKSQSTE